MSGLRPSPAIRAARLEQKAAEHELRSGAGLTAPERAWERALTLAPAEEVEEHNGLCDLSQALQPGTFELLEVLLRISALRETIMGRASPTLAVVFRQNRDLVLRGLLQAEAAELEEADVPGRRTYRGRAETLFEARVRLEHAIRSGLEPLTDLDRGGAALAALLEAVDAGDVGRALELAAHQDPGEAPASPETSTET